MAFICCPIHRPLSSLQKVLGPEHTGWETKTRVSSLPPTHGELGKSLLFSGFGVHTQGNMSDFPMLFLRTEFLGFLWRPSLPRSSA